MTDRFSSQRPDWRIYQSRQSRLRRNRKRRPRSWKVLKGAGLFAMILAGVYVISHGVTNSAVITGTADSPLLQSILPVALPDPKPPTVASGDATFPIHDKNGIQAVLKDDMFVNLQTRDLTYEFDGHRLRIITSIDDRLQRFILDHLQRDTSRYIGLVVMDPDSGKILSMVSHDRNDPTSNIATTSIFPAASVFKIVTAAAVVEEYGLRADATFTYSGGKHTLYKSQLKMQSNRQLHRISLAESFAQSINPVFGKIGIHYLGKRTLESYAGAFGFNRPIPFDLPVTPSHVLLTDDPYQWAEVASGFNRMTTISPLHGAMMVSALISAGGRMAEPAIVDQILDDDGQVLYQSHSSTRPPVLTPTGASALRSMMEETIASGTCRKAFRGFQEDPVLSRLTIGGKTGTINSHTHEGRRIDWFVGYAEEKEGPQKIAVAIVICHEKYIGMYAKQFARLVMADYFAHCFASATPQSLTALENLPEGRGEDGDASPEAGPDQQDAEIKE